MAITIDYNKAYNEANRLQTAANECANMILAHKRALADLRSYWEGASADAFVKAGEDWNKEMDSVKSELFDLSNTIKAVTDAIKEADRRAAAAAKSE
jgi:WXG100 family type VII secretion target